MSVNVKKEVNLSSIELIRSFPFYGHILVQLPKIFLSKDNSLGIPTLGVGKDKKEDILIKLYICLDYVQHVYEEHGNKKGFMHLIEVLKHEILHIVFGHLAIDMPDKQRLAIACDLAVNSYVNKDKMISSTDPKTGQKRTQGCFAEDYGLESKKSALWYYAQLLKNPKYKQQCEDGQFGVDGFMSDVVNKHSLWDKIKEDPMLNEMMRDLVRKATKICRETNKWGDIPGDLIDQLDDLTKHKKALIPWKQLLRVFIASAMESNLAYTIKRRSRRYGTRPGTKKEDVLKLAIGIDTSGSISEEQLNMFFSELYWIHKNGAKITVIECDTQIQREYPYEQFDGRVQGRGGTDLEPVLKQVSEQKYDALIFFTDFYTGEIKTNYGIPILWVLSHCNLSPEEYPYAWGHHIKINADNTIETA